MKLGLSLACCLSYLRTEMQRAFWSSLSILGTHLAEMHLMFKLSAKVRWMVPYDSPTISNIVGRLPVICKDSLTNFCYVFWHCACQRSSRMLIVNRHSSILEAFWWKPSLKHLYHKKCLLWLMALSPKASCSIWWVSAVILLRLKQNLLLKIGHIRCKKNSLDC
jgi:hypothetical protein